MSRRSLALWLAALAMVIVQAMALATRYYQPWLDGDYLLAERFATDVLSGTHPLSGWTLSSSPYWFPDFALSIVWRAVLGLEGTPLLPYYVVTSYAALALLAGWSLQRVRGPGNHGWLLGAVLVDVLLAWQGAADHARWLWWLGTPDFHGGAVLLGLAQFALWAGPATERPPGRRVVVATVLLFLGLASDTLLLTQFIAPLAAALFLAAPKPRRLSPRLIAFAKAIGVALLLVVLLRVILLLAHWGHFPSVLRYAPTPGAIASTGRQMVADLAGPVLRAVPGFLGLFALALPAAWWLSRRHSPSNPQRLAGWFAALCVLSTVALPVLAVYWRNPQHGRYLLPCLVIPLWWVLSLVPLARLRAPLVAGLAAVLLGLAVWRVPQIDFAKWSLPHPERVAALDAFLRDEGRSRGLADFWHANLINATSRAGLRLNQLRPDGRVQFWGNNAFHHYDSAGADGALRSGPYSFIIADNLDADALRGKFGEPREIVGVAGYTVWLYDAAGAQRLNALTRAEVQAFLDDRPGSERLVP